MFAEEVPFFLVLVFLPHSSSYFILFYFVLCYFILFRAVNLCLMLPLSEGNWSLLVLCLLPPAWHLLLLDLLLILSALDRQQTTGQMISVLDWLPLEYTLFTINVGSRHR